MMLPKDGPRIITLIFYISKIARHKSYGATAYLWFDYCGGVHFLIDTRHQRNTFVLCIWGCLSLSHLRCFAQGVQEDCVARAPRQLPGVQKLPGVGTGLFITINV